MIKILQCGEGFTIFAKGSWSFSGTEKQKRNWLQTTCITGIAFPNTDYPIKKMHGFHPSFCPLRQAKMMESVSKKSVRTVIVPCYRYHCLYANPSCRQMGWCCKPTACAYLHIKKGRVVKRMFYPSVWEYWGDKTGWSPWLYCSQQFQSKGCVPFCFRKTKCMCRACSCKSRLQDQNFRGKLFIKAGRLITFTLREFCQAFMCCPWCDSKCHMSNPLETTSLPWFFLV